MPLIAFCTSSGVGESIQMGRSCSAGKGREDVGDPLSLLSSSAKYALHSERSSLSLEGMIYHASVTLAKISVQTKQLLQLLDIVGFLTLCEHFINCRILGMERPEQNNNIIS